MANPVRQKKIAERLKEEIAIILQNELKDPRVGMISVVAVKVSQDLRDARVFVSVLGKPGDKTKAMKALQHARGFIQTLVAKRIEVRFAPILAFLLDESIERSIRVSKIIDGIAAERRTREAAARGITMEQLEAEEEAARKKAKAEGRQPDECAPEPPAPGSAEEGGGAAGEKESVEPVDDDENEEEEEDDDDAEEGEDGDEGEDEK